MAGESVYLVLHSWNSLSPPTLLFDFTQYGYTSDLDTDAMTFDAPVGIAPGRQYPIDLLGNTQGTYKDTTLTWIYTLLAPDSTSDIAAPGWVDTAYSSLRSALTGTNADGSSQGKGKLTCYVGYPDTITPVLASATARYLYAQRRASARTPRSLQVTLAFYMFSDFS